MVYTHLVYTVPVTMNDFQPKSGQNDAACESTFQTVAIDFWQIRVNMSVNLFQRLVSPKVFDFQVMYLKLKVHFNWSVISRTFVLNQPHSTLSEKGTSLLVKLYITDKEFGPFFVRKTQYTY